MKRKNPLKFLLILMLFLGVGLVVASIYNPVTDYIQVNNQDKELMSFISEGNDAVDSGDNVFTVDWDKLLAANPKIIAWLRIPDTNISYPVIKPSNNDEFLRRNIYGNSMHAGSIFVESTTYKPFYNGNTIVYGHNLNNGKMFSQIRNFSDKSFAEKHKEVYVYLADGNIQRYKVYGFAKVKSNNTCVYYTNFDNPTVLASFYENLNPFLSYKLGGDTTQRCLTLSTCTNRDDDERYVLLATLEEEIEEYAQEYGNGNGIDEVIQN